MTGYPVKNNYNSLQRKQWKWVETKLINVISSAWISRTLLTVVKFAKTPTALHQQTSLETNFLTINSKLCTKIGRHVPNSYPIYRTKVYPPKFSRFSSALLRHFTARFKTPPQTAAVQARIQVDSQLELWWTPPISDECSKWSDDPLSGELRALLSELVITFSEITFNLHRSVD